MRRKRFHVVKTNNPTTVFEADAGANTDADVFDNLDALREAKSPSAKKRLDRSEKWFAPITLGRARTLYRHGGGPAWLLFCVLDLLVRVRKRNPVQWTPQMREAAGLSRWGQDCGLHQLEQAGFITVDRKPGRSPFVTLRDYPTRG
jgi:hypothetical protein